MTTVGGHTDMARLSGAEFRVFDCQVSSVQNWLVVIEVWVELENLILN